MKQALTTNSVDYSSSLAKVSVEIYGDEFKGKLYNAYGTQVAPPVGTPCLVVSIGNNDANKYVFPLQTDVSQIEDGEYQTGNFKQGNTIIFKADGTIQIQGATDVEINGNDKRFVTYAELDSALQTFITALNTRLNGKLDGSATTPATLSIDISASETQTVKTGG